VRCHPVIAIDGPAGTGKTTSAAAVARHLGFAYVDSGALYRAIAHAARKRGISGPEDPSLGELLADLPLRAGVDGGLFRVFLGDEEISGGLRDPEVSSLSSKLAVHPGVRDKVCSCLRELSASGPAVIEGRDIGTAVFPSADLKIFLTASIEERARRRSNELRGKGQSQTDEEVARAIAERDRRDSEREIAPLRRAPDAVEIDTTETDVEGQVRLILEAWEKRDRPRIRTDYAINQWVFRTGARLLWGLRGEGIENVPRSGGVILASNHKSYLDPPLIGSILPREIHYLGKKELFRMPLLGAWVRTHNVIPIDREGFDRSGLETALGVVRGGGALLLFPEGTRIRRPGMGPPREGVGFLVARSGVPVVPVHVRGTWGPERRWFRSGGITIRYGVPVVFPPVPPGRAGRLQFPEIAREIVEAISALGGGKAVG
jgi:cytidylate kinase